MKRRVGARGFAIAMLVLAAIVATPAFSVAQDTGTTTTPSDPNPLPEPPREAQPPPAGDTDQSGDPAQTEETVTAERSPAAGPTSARGALAHASASATVSMGDNFYSPASVSIASSSMAVMPRCANGVVRIGRLRSGVVPARRRER